MNYISKVFAVILTGIATLTAFSLTACTQQGVYESIQNDQRNECTKEPNLAAQEKCNARLMPYKEYKEKIK